MVALTVAACGSSTPTPTSDVEWAGGAGTQVETPSSTPTAMIDAGSGAGTPLQTEVSSSTPTPTSDVEWAGGAGTQVETPSSTPTATGEVGSDTVSPTQAETPSGTAGTTPTPASAPVVGQSEPAVDHEARDAQRLREVMEEFPERMKTWIDQDTIVYLLNRHPHGSEGDLIAVALYLPTRTVKNYELVIDGNGQASITLYSERTSDSPEGRAASLRLEEDPRVADAALHLLTTVKRWSKN